MSVINQAHEEVAIGLLTPHPDNPRRGNVEAIRDSIATNGFYGSLVVQRSTGFVLVGNHRLYAARELGYETVPVTYVNVDDMTARRILAADNRTSDLGLYDDEALVALLESVRAEEPEHGLGGTGYDDSALDELMASLAEGGDAEDERENIYTDVTNVPQYNPVGPPPPLSELIDRTRTDELSAEIRAAQLPEDVTEFLLAAAQRHTVFNYRKVAEYYPHATPEVKRLFETSALVIIDPDDAIRLGYLKLENSIAGLIGEELESDDDEES